MASDKWILVAGDHQKLYQLNKSFILRALKLFKPIHILTINLILPLILCFSPWVLPLFSSSLVWIRTPLFIRNSVLSVALFNQIYGRKQISTNMAHTENNCPHRAAKQQITDEISWHRYIQTHTHTHMQHYAPFLLSASLALMWWAGTSECYGLT